MSSRDNKLRAWFAQNPQPMTKEQFAIAIGVTRSYVSQLAGDNPPWPKRELALRIALVTRGFVTPNDLAGYTRLRKLRRQRAQA